MKKPITLLIIAYTLNLIDYCQTKYVVSHFGLNAELNQFARFLFSAGYAEIIKLIAPIILLAALGLIVKLDKTFIWTAYFVVILYSLVVLHNSAIIIILIGGKPMNTICIVCTVITALSAIACGMLCAYYKHLKKK